VWDTGWNQQMLKSLHLKLTLLYLLVAMLLAFMVGGSAYSLLNYYFQSRNDMALKYKMAITFESINVPLPPELVLAEHDWQIRQGSFLFSSPVQNNNSENSENKEDESREFQAGKPYEGELSSIIVFPLDASGKLIFNPNPFLLPMQPDVTAAKAALQKGSDLRTIRLSDGTPVRLLSYALPPESGFGIIQLGHLLGDQVGIMVQFTTGMLILGAISTLVLGIGSWWLAGKSLAPTQKAWEMQQMFIANASHELRTPLTLIRASSEVVLRQSDESSNQKELLSDVISECDHMAQLVDDLLLLSRLDTRQLKLERTPIPLNDMLIEIKRQFERLAVERGIQLKCSDTSVEVLGDSTRLRQVFIILLDNALRHTPDGGGIELSVSLTGRFVKIDVADNGEGIPPEHLDHVFDRFYQVDSSYNGKKEGNGLGLSIAKALVEAQEGRISIDSKTGKGTTVTIVLPSASTINRVQR
jgi:signal transduction histidine kinase